LIFLLAQLACEGNSGKYPIKNFAPSEYGAGIQNIDFAQNRDLDLFVANNLGVLSFNGTTWGKHALNTGKKYRSLAFDETTNRLYSGSQGDFGYFEGDWHYVSLRDKTPPEFVDFDEVWDVLLFDSKVYFCTFQGIYIYDGDTVSTITREGGFNRSFRAGNRLFTQSPTGALFEIQGRSLIALSQQSHGHDVAAGVIRSEDGYVVLYNSGRVELLDAPGSTKLYEGMIQALSGNYVNHVRQISDGRVVVSTQRAGLFLFDQQANLLDHISLSDGLMSNACLRVFQDHGGNLWVGMQNGIAVIDIDSPLRLINQDIDLQGSGYEAYETEEGAYYTTSNGIYFLPNNVASSQFLTGTEGPAYGLQLINGNLYAGHHTGLFLLKKGKAIRKAICNGLWQVKALRSNPRYVLGGTYAGLHLFEFDSNGELMDAGKIAGFNESSRFFEEDRKGRIWVGQYYKGLFLVTLTNAFQNAEVKKISDSSALPLQQYIFLSLIDDQLYICTTKGIFKLDQATDQIMEEDMFTRALGKNWVYLLVQDRQQNVYVYSENHVGMFRQMSPGNYVYVPSSLFQLRQSFNNDLLNVSRHVKTGVLFNANEGFIHYNPEREEGVSVSNEPLVSRAYSVADDSILYMRMPFGPRPENMGTVQITESSRVVQFVVESFKFKDVSNQQFRYHLSGFDRGYGAWTTTGLKEYTNLKVGTYVFHVQTVNSRGEILTGKPLRIEVMPSFYNRPLARVLYVVIGCLVLYQLYRMQRQYYRAKQSRLEQAKQRELAQKQRELQELKEEQIRSELGHLNSLLAASAMNLVVKNEFMENIKEEIRQAKLTDKLEDQQRALDRIIKEIDTTLKVQEDWKQFEIRFDRVHGDFLKRLTAEFTELTPGEQKLCAFLRLKMDTKEIANLMGISLRGVEVTRYRLRKKFKLETQQNLSKFILEY
jgi:DNA-binding CsgD family transcriptional regulator